MFTTDNKTLVTIVFKIVPIITYLDINTYEMTKGVYDNHKVYKIKMNTYVGM